MILREASGHAVCQNRIYKMINLLWNSSGEFLLPVTLKKKKYKQDGAFQKF
jgi:hypothetical protein